MAGTMRFLTKDQLLKVIKKLEKEIAYNNYFRQPNYNQLRMLDDCKRQYRERFKK